MSEKIDFYAPLKRKGKLLHGAAAMNVRVAEMGGANAFGATMIETGLRLGYQAALAKFAARKKLTA